MWFEVLGFGPTAKKELLTQFWCKMVVFFKKTLFLCYKVVVFLKHGDRMCRQKEPHWGCDGGLIKYIQVGIKSLRNFGNKVSRTLRGSLSGKGHLLLFSKTSVKRPFRCISGSPKFGVRLPNIYHGLEVKEVSKGILICSGRLTGSWGVGLRLSFLSRGRSLCFKDLSRGCRQ